MINLIPPEGQKILRWEYVFRVGGTLGALFGGIFLMLAVALVPTYVLIGAQIKSSLAEAKKDNGEREAFAKADEEVKTTKALIRQLKSSVPPLTMSEAIEEINRVVPKGISFKTFVVDDKGGKILKIQAQGTATTREVLAELKSSLEASALFEKAEVPIADLARDVSLPFTITITLSEPK